jgi:hypothetical protein
VRANAVELMLDCLVEGTRVNGSGWKGDVHT